ncbi:MAG: hypothetical protein AAF990_10530 [Bacteroidota bacterium]
MKLLQLHFAWVLLLLVVFGTGCQKFDKLEDLELSERDAEYAVPVFRTSTSLQDVLEEFDSNTVVQIQSDGSMLLNYRGKVTARTSQEIFEITNEITSAPLIITDTFMALPFAIPNGIDIDYAILKGGSIQILWQANHKEDISLKVSVLSLLTPEGEVFTKTYDADYAGNTMEPIMNYIDSEISLDGYIVRPDQDSLYVSYELIRKSTGLRDTVSGMILLIEDLNASYMEGYLGGDIYEMDRDTIEIDFFENWTRGDVYFADPKIRLTVENSFGFPVRSKANLVEVLTVDGDRLPLRSTFIDDGINVDYPGLDEIGEVKVTNFAFDKTNSNVDSILAAGPIAVDYDFDAVPNPDQDTTIRGFITDTSSLRALVEVDLPVFGSTAGFAVNDTFDADFVQFDEVEYAEFKLVTENEIPLEVAVQLYFADPAGQIIDSLFERSVQVIEGAPVDAEGNAIDVVKKETFIRFDEARFNRIRQSDKIYMTAAFSTTNNGMSIVKVLSSQKTNIRMGMKVGLKED